MNAEGLDRMKRILARDRGKIIAAVLAAEARFEQLAGGPRAIVEDFEERRQALEGFLPKTPAERREFWRARGR